MKIYRLAQEELQPEEQAVGQVGYHPDEADHTTAPVNWDESDVQMLAPWNEKTVREFLSLPSDAIIYKSLVPISELREELAEETEDLSGEDDENTNSYDWSELQSRRTHPPPIVVTLKENGSLVINDGNHRVRFWSENGYLEAPVWVYDEKLTIYFRNKQGNGKKP